MGIGLELQYGTNGSSTFAVSMWTGTGADYLGSHEAAPQHELRRRLVSGLRDTLGRPEIGPGWNARTA